MQQIKLFDYWKEDGHDRSHVTQVMQSVTGRATMSYREWFGETAGFIVFIYHRDGEALDLNAMSIRVNPLDYLQVDYDRLIAVIEPCGALVFRIIERDGQATDLTMTLWSAADYQDEVAPLIISNKDKGEMAERLFSHSERHVHQGWLRGYNGLPAGGRVTVEERLGCYW